MYTLLVKTLSGFENFLADDIRKYGGEIISIQNRSVTCKGDYKTIVDLNVCSGVALFVYIQLEEFYAGSKHEYTEKSRKVPFVKYVSTDQTFAVKSDVFQCSWIDNSMYASMLLKDSIADAQRAHSGKRSDINVKHPDIEFYQYIYKNYISIYINTSGEPLYKRGYKTLTARAPLNEVLAHGILRLTGYMGDQVFINPFCGTGTFISEAILLTGHRWPNQYRVDFAFSNFNWQPFREYWHTLISRSAENHLENNVVYYGIDNDSKSIDTARRSLVKISKYGKVHLLVSDFFSWKNPVREAFIIMNVPYNRRLKMSPEPFFSRLGDILKKKYSGSECWILSAGREHTRYLGLKSSQTIALYNGQIQVFLQQFFIH